MLKGKRIMLRAAEPEDLDLMYLIENDTALWNYGSANVPYSMYSLKLIGSVSMRSVSSRNALTAL